MMRVAWLVVALMCLATTAAAQSSAQIELGKKVYADQKCGVCHSIDGVGNKRGALDGVGAKLSVEDIRLWMTDAPGMSAKTKSERKPAMKSYPQLSKDELDAIVAYMASLKK